MIYDIDRIAGLYLEISSGTIFIHADNCSWVGNGHETNLTNILTAGSTKILKLQVSFY